MPPTLRLRVTSKTIAIELDGVGVVFEEDAVLAVRYDARGEDVALLAAGRPALTIPDRLREIDLMDARGRAPCIVPLEQARWYDGDRGLGASPAPVFADPWEHHGEILIARPFEPGGGSVRTWVWLLHSTWSRFVAEALPARLGYVRRRWLLLRAEVDVILPEWPSDPEEHDRLLRSLRYIFGRRVLVGGAPAKLNRAEERWWQQSWPVVVPVALVAVLMAMAWAFPGARPALRHALAIDLICLLAAFLHAEWRGGADHADRSARSPRREALVGPESDPAEYESADRYRLGLTERGQALTMLFSFIGFVAGLAGGVARSRARPPEDFDLMPLMVMVIAGMVLGAWLGFRLTRTHISLGARGFTLRLLGHWSHPLRVPYARLRHAMMKNPGELKLVFHDEHAISIGFKAYVKAESALLLQIEAELSQRLRSPGSYRTSGPHTKAGRG